MMKTSPVQVEFIGENGIDGMGLSAEFFSLLSKSLLNWEKRLLEVHETLLVWFNPNVSSTPNTIPRLLMWSSTYISYVSFQRTQCKDFYYLGVICGMALYNHHCVNIDFPLALFKKLLQLSPTLNDLEELSPVEAR